MLLLIQVRRCSEKQDISTPLNHPRHPPSFDNTLQLTINGHDPSEGCTQPSAFTKPTSHLPR